jgi:hypothetical protein
MTPPNIAVSLAAQRLPASAYCSLLRRPTAGGPWAAVGPRTISFSTGPQLPGLSPEAQCIVHDIIHRPTFGPVCLSLSSTVVLGEASV